MGFNRIILEGRLTKDVELRYSNSGIAMAKGSIAVGKKFTSNGEKKEKTLFVNLQFWQRSAEIFNQYCRKGSHILVEGELENANWTDNQGNKKYDFIVNVSSMQMLDSKSDSTSTDKNNYQQPQQPQQYQPKNDGTTTQPTPTYEAQQGDGSYKAVPPPQQVPAIDISEDEIIF